MTPSAHVGQPRPEPGFGSRVGQVLRAVAIMAAMGLLTATAPPAGDGARGVSVLLVVVVVASITGAYLAAHFLVDRLQQRLLVMSGAEYILLGVLLGPSVGLVPDALDLSVARPAMALAVGWMGLLLGLDVRLGPTNDDSHAGSMRTALVHALGVGVPVGWVAYEAIGVLGQGIDWSLGLVSAHQVRVLTAPLSASLSAPLPVRESARALGAGLAGCVAATVSGECIELIRKRYGAQGSLLALLTRSAHLIDLFAVGTFGVLVCVFRQADMAGGFELRPAEWVMVAVAIGLLLGLLFRPFVGDNTPANRFLAVVGVITFSSGAAYVLKLSPLLVNLILGATVANSSHSGQRMRQKLAASERPITLMLFITAGLLWRPPARPGVVMLGLVALVFGRYLLRVVASKLSAFGTRLRGDLYRGMWAHGGMAVAMIVSFRLVYAGPLADTIYTLLLVATVLEDTVGPRALRTLLIDAGEMRASARASAVSGLGQEQLGTTGQAAASAELGMDNAS